MALMVVDEAVLALTGGTYPDPLDSFWQERDAEVQHRQIREKVELALADEIATPVPALASASGAAGATNITFAENYRETLSFPLTGAGTLSQFGPFEVIGNRDAGIGAFQGAQSISGAEAFPSACFAPPCSSHSRVRNPKFVCATTSARWLSICPMPAPTRPAGSTCPSSYPTT
jgi:hypothetical protein